MRGSLKERLKGAISNNKVSCGFVLISWTFAMSMKKLYYQVEELNDSNLLSTFTLELIILLVGVVLLAWGIREGKLAAKKSMTEQHGVSMELVEIDFQNAKELSPVFYVGNQFTYLLSTEQKKVIPNEEIAVVQPDQRIVNEHIWHRMLIFMKDGTNCEFEVWDQKEAEAIAAYYRQYFPEISVRNMGNNRK